MGQPVKHVLLTYATNPVYWLIFAFAALFSAPLICAVVVFPWLHDAHSLRAMSLWVALPAGTVAFLVALQTKLQFAHPRARLMPGFALPHLIIPVVSLLITAFGLPLVVSYLAIGDALPITCWVACLVASLIWAVHLHSGWAAMLALSIGFSATWPRSAAFWGLSAAGGFSEPHPLLWLLLLGAWGAICVWLARLLRLHEEMEEYESRIQISSWDRSARPARFEGRQFAALQRRRGWWLASWCIDQWHDRIAANRVKRSSSGAALADYGFAAQPGWIYALGMALILLFLCYLFLAMGVFGKDQADAPVGIAILVLQFATLMPATMCHTLLVGRWPRLSQELLLPHSRGEWVNNLVRALRRQVLWMVAALQCVLLILALRWWDYLLAPGSLSTYLSLALGSLLLSTAAAIWIASYYRGILGGSLVAFVSMPLLSLQGWWLWQRDRSGDAPFLVGGLVLIAAGCLVMRQTRRRWLSVELGR